jgi:hypothetical protein
MVGFMALLLFQMEMLTRSCRQIQNLGYTISLSTQLTFLQPQVNTWALETILLVKYLDCAGKRLPVSMRQSGMLVFSEAQMLLKCTSMKLLL